MEKQEQDEAAINELAVSEDNSQPEANVFDDAKTEIGWNYLQAIIAFLIAFIFSVMTLSLLHLLVPQIEEGPYSIIASIIQGMALIFIPYLIARRYHFNQSWQRLGFDKTKGYSPFIKGIMWGVGLYFVAIIINIFIITYIIEEPQIQGVMHILMESKSLWVKAGLIFCIIVVAPISEEVFFRGFLYAALRKKWGVKIAAFTSGLAFALVHFDLMVIVSFTVLGIGFALLYEKTQSLISSIMAHCIFNLISVVLLFLSLYAQNIV